MQALQKKTNTKGREDYGLLVQLCHVEKRDDVYRLFVKEHFFGGETKVNAPAYHAEFSLREVNLCIADVTSWAKAVANA